MCSNIKATKHASIKIYLFINTYVYSFTKTFKLIAFYSIICKDIGNNTNKKPKVEWKKNVIHYLFVTLKSWYSSSEWIYSYITFEVSLWLQLFPLWVQEWFTSIFYNSYFLFQMDVIVFTWEHRARKPKYSSQEG